MTCCSAVCTTARAELLVLAAALPEDAARQIENSRVVDGLDGHNARAIAGAARVAIALDDFPGASRLLRAAADPTAEITGLRELVELVRASGRKSIHCLTPRVSVAFGMQRSPA